MVTPQIHIGALRCRYHLKLEPVAARAFAQQVERGCIGTMGEALEALAPSIYIALGLSPQARIALRRLNVRIRLKGDAYSARRLATAWAQAIAEAIERSLRLAPNDGGTEQAAVFRDQTALEEAYLAARLRGSPREWWWAALLAEAGRLPSSADILRNWLDSDPLRVSNALVSMAHQHPGGLATALPEPDARMLADTLRAVTVARAAEIGSVPMDHPDPGAVAHVVRTAPAQLRTALAQAPPELRRLILTTYVIVAHPSRIALLPAQDANWPALWSGLESLFHAGSHTSVERAPMLWEHSPAAASMEPANPAGGERPTLFEASVDMEPSTGWIDAVAGGYRGSDSPPAAREPTSGDVEAVQAGATTGVSRHAIGCGGLLFMVRRVAQHALVRRNAGGALEERLAAFALEVLQRVLEPLPEPDCKVRLEQEWPLLRVFCGAIGEGDPLALAIPQQTRDEASAALDEIVANLPVGLSAVPGGFLGLYGRREEEIAASGANRALARLVVRPGMLVLERTRAMLYLPQHCVDIALRREGWDIDPGWVPHLGRVIRFQYGEAAP